MRVDFYGLTFETPQVSFHLWSPWRSSSLEHRLYDAVLRLIPKPDVEKQADEWRIKVRDARTLRTALQALERVLKGWQEEADPGSERRTWRWLLEGDSDANGFDHGGEPFGLWGFVRVSVERGGPGEPEKGEDIDLEGFSFRLWGTTPDGETPEGRN
jgi:hypothetical protein